MTKNNNLNKEKIINNNITNKSEEERDTQDKSRHAILDNANFAHVYVEGIGDLKIFKDKRNRDRYVNTIRKFSKKYYQDVIAYCVMNDHAHIIFKVNNIDTLSTCMKSINLSYSQNYNKNHKRKGFVFNGRYQSDPLYTPQDLIQCIAFVHSDPVEQNLEKFAEDYLHSSAHEYGLSVSDIVNFDVVRSIFGGRIPLISSSTKRTFKDRTQHSAETLTEVIKELTTRFNVTKETMKDNILLQYITVEAYKRTDASLRDITRELEEYGVSRERVRRSLGEYKEVLFADRKKRCRNKQ